jgi:CheY-like chemotaxis protein/HPt (histidine-containing phosphotransfer) domain-containing protein
MGGTIGVTSHLGGGSNFWFTVPFDKEASGPEELPEPPNYDDLKVLLVDDVSSSRKIIETYLSQWRARFVSTARIEDALSNLRRGYEGKDAFSLVLVNSSSPLRQLITSALGLVEEGRDNQIQIVLAYGLSDSQSEQSLLDQYFPLRISKPVKGSELLAYLSNLSKSEALPMLDVPLVTNVEKRRQPGELLNRLKTVLVVEDNQVNTRVILMELEELGLRAEAVGNGVEALRVLAEKPYDVVLMDCQMPEMDGFEATKLIREREAAKGGHIPIIAMTAQAMDGDRERCLSAGMDDYLSKPIDFNLLERSLQRWIPSSQTHHELSVAGGNHLLAAGQDAKIGSQERPLLVDLNYLHSKYNRERVHELVQLFVDSSGQLITKIEEAISRQDAAKLRTTAHELAGSCMMLRMTAMFEESRRLERIGQDPKWTEASACLVSLKQSFEATKETVWPVLK